MLIQDQLLDRLLADMLRKKPVNSDHFSIVRKLRPDEKFSKRPWEVKVEKPGPINARIKEVMDAAGFSYGRLKEKNWVVDTGDKKMRMVAPGPVLRAIHRPEVPQVHFNDKFKARYPQGFDKPSYNTYSSQSVDTKKHSEASTARFLSQSPSRRQAKEYLQFLTAITSEEKKVLQSKIEGKINDFKNELHLKVPKMVADFNNRGIFSTEVNEIRANSMLNVSLKNQMKIQLEPIVRKVKAEVLLEKMQAYNANVEKEVKLERNSVEEQVRRVKLLKEVEDTVAKKQEIKRENDLDHTVTPDNDWKESLSNSINKIKAKCTPKELAMPILK